MQASVLHDQSPVEVETLEVFAEAVGIVGQHAPEERRAEQRAARLRLRRHVETMCASYTRSNGLRTVTALDGNWPVRPP